jgi:hypothetical protein
MMVTQTEQWSVYYSYNKLTYYCILLSRYIIHQSDPRLLCDASKPQKLNLSLNHCRASRPHRAVVKYDLTTRSANRVKGMWAWKYSSTYSYPSHALAASPQEKNPRYQFKRRLGEPQSRSGHGSEDNKLRFLAENRNPVVQPVANCHNWVIINCDSKTVERKPIIAVSWWCPEGFRKPKRTRPGNRSGVFINFINTASDTSWRQRIARFFYETWRFIAVFSNASHCTLSWAS